MEYTFSQHVTREDYVAFVTNHMKISFFKPFNIVLFVVSIGYLMLSPFILGTGEFNFLFIGLGLVALLAGMFFYAKRNAKKQYDKNPDSFNMSYEVNDEALVYIFTEQNITKKWIEFYSAAETEEYLYIYVNKNSGLVLVKRDIPNDALNFVKDKIRLHLNAKRIKLLS